MTLYNISLACSKIDRGAWHSQSMFTTCERVWPDVTFHQVYCPTSSVALELTLAPSHDNMCGSN